MSRSSSQTLGLSFSDSTVEGVLLSGAGKSMRVAHQMSRPIPEELLDRGHIVDASLITSFITGMLGEELPEQDWSRVTCVVNVPDAYVYTTFFDLSDDASKHRARAIRKEISWRVPLRPNDMVVWSHDLGVCTTKTEETFRRFVATAFSREVGKAWLAALGQIGFAEVVLDTEAFAGARPFLDKKDPVMIVDIGTDMTSIGVFDTKNMPALMYSVPMGGRDCTNALMRETKVADLAQAQKQKLTIDLTKTRAAATKAVMPVMSHIITELQRALTSATESGMKPKRIVLVGGGSRLKGLDKLVMSELGIKKVAIGSTKEVNSELVVAYGLALGVHQGKTWAGIQPLFGEDDMAKKSPLIKRSSAPLRSRVSTSRSSAIASPTNNARTQHQKKKRLKAQRYILIGVLVVGIVLLGVMFWVRNQARDDRALEVSEQLVQFDQVTYVDVAIPIALTSEDADPSAIRGRLIEDSVEVAATYDEARARSRRNVLQLVDQTTERLWDDPVIRPERAPVDDVTPTDSVGTPVELPAQFAWLIYTYDDVDRIAGEAVAARNLEGVEYSLNNITIEDLVIEDGLLDEKLYSLDIIVAVATSEDFVNEMMPTEPEDTAAGVLGPIDDQLVSIENVEALSQDLVQGTIPQSTSVLISNTPIGYLNVRVGAGTQFAIVTRVSPGEQYGVIEQQNDWYHIELPDTDAGSGWVIADYVEESTS